MMKLDTATKQLLKDPAKRRAWVIYQLNLQGRSLASLARDHQLDRTAPQQALRHPYPRMERFIAEAVQMPVHELFPERYAPTGERLIRMGRPVGSGKKSIAKDTAKTRRRNVGGNTPDRQQGDAA